VSRYLLDTDTTIEIFRGRNPGAVSALAHPETAGRFLANHNTLEFIRVPDLNLEDWSYFSRSLSRSGSNAVRSPIAGRKAHTR
jgi:hypothetical protein